MRCVSLMVLSRSFILCREFFDHPSLPIISAISSRRSFLMLACSVMSNNVCVNKSVIGCIAENDNASCIITGSYATSLHSHSSQSSASLDLYFSSRASASRFNCSRRVTTGCMIRCASAMSSRDLRQSCRNQLTIGRRILGYSRRVFEALNAVMV